ncbi:hypothetical protein [Jonquetella anthropi]|nr:hypothetical protein [Jonquetella anthropi]
MADLSAEVQREGSRDEFFPGGALVVLLATIKWGGAVASGA